jgi:hypothetical protein
MGILTPGQVGKVGIALESTSNPGLALVLAPTPEGGIQALVVKSGATKVFGHALIKQISSSITPVKSE